MIEPLVSVVIIFWNEERFLREAVESVFGQDYANWELLLVDDGSTDQSSAIARQYAEEHPDQVRYLTHAGHKNRGMSASRNLALGHAAGKYVAILDADDVWLPDTLPDQVMILEARPAAALVYGRVQRWYSWSAITDDRQRDSFRELAVPADSLVEPPTQLVLLLQDKGMPSGFMIRREVMQRVGGYEESFRGMYEDNAFLVKVCLRNAVFASNECWYRYRKHQQSASSLAVSAGRYQTARLEFLKWVETYLANEQIVDPRIWNVLRRELRPLRHPRLHQLIDRARGWFRLRSELSPR